MFQSTHPARGATSLVDVASVYFKFQSTHPARGATYRHLQDRPRGCFNPRTPPGVRHHLAWWPQLHCSFNPRTPPGVRHPEAWRPKLHCSFNPRTPPGVRPVLGILLPTKWMVSIHAPRPGCDILLLFSYYLLNKFQSTHPARGATLAVCFAAARDV